jgi:hypothetical protein
MALIGAAKLAFFADILKEKIGTAMGARRAILHACPETV